MTCHKDLTRFERIIVGQIFAEILLSENKSRTSHFFCFGFGSINTKAAFWLLITSCHDLSPITNTTITTNTTSITTTIIIITKSLMRERKFKGVS